MLQGGLELQERRTGTWRGLPVALASSTNQRTYDNDNYVLASTIRDSGSSHNYLSIDRGLIIQGKRDATDKM